MKLITRSLLACLLVSGIAYTFAAPKAMAQQKTEDRHLSGFHIVDVGGPFDVKITQGQTESVRVEAPADLISHVTTEVEDGELKIYNKHNDMFHWGDLFHHRKVLVYVTIKDITGVIVSGSGDVTFAEGLHANDLDLHVSGSGDAQGMVEVKEMHTSISGSGDVKLSGHAETSHVQVSGSGDYSGRDLHTSETTVRVSGSGDASVYTSSRVDAYVSGSGDVSYSGHPQNVAKATSGSGSIHGD